MSKGRVEQTDRRGRKTDGEGGGKADRERREIEGGQTDERKE